MCNSSFLPDKNKKNNIEAYNEQKDFNSGEPTC